MKNKGEADDVAPTFSFFAQATRTPPEEASVAFTWANTIAPADGDKN